MSYFNVNIPEFWYSQKQEDETVKISESLYHSKS